jgi:hypothetical protein
MSEVAPHSTKLQPEGELVPPSVPGTQPEPLEELSDEERAEWRKFTSRMPADWFPPETWAMLAQLCRHICQARWVGQCLQEVRAGLLDPTDDEALKVLMKLQSLHDREGRAMTALMVRLRLTSQQRIPDADVADRARERVKQEHVDEPPWAASGRRIAAGVERTQ